MEKRRRDGLVAPVALYAERGEAKRSAQDRQREDPTERDAQRLRRISAPGESSIIYVDPATDRAVLEL